ncbi:ATPase PAAT [Eucyclogobius newberryi]|uniref:ATPase PAAT n=1 Tax=Eucyclogobius newberryi TaxID=166745 RepID=UPI003B5A8DD4
MVDLSSSWVCETEGRSLSDVLNIQNHHDPNENREQNGVAGPVLLSQPEESAPCLLSLNCRPPAAIAGLELVSEARTAEVYDQSGEYCGTARGEPRPSADSPDSETFYRKRLLLDRPATSCQVKLLSLCGRRRVRVLAVSVVVSVATEAERSGVSVNHSVDLQRVRSMMEDMGTSLSPGAQHLMDMVQSQQQNHTSSLTSLFPLLIGGRSQLQVTPSVTDSPSNQNGAMSHDSPDSPCSESSESRSPVSPAHITEMMSQLLRGRGQADLLPVLQSVCGHVTQLRLDNGVALKETSDVTCSVQMERRLEQMEQRLKEHLDKRLDALEQKLDSVLNLALMNKNYELLTAKNPAEETRNQATKNCA